MVIGDEKTARARVHVRAEHLNTICGQPFSHPPFPATNTRRFLEYMQSVLAPLARGTCIQRELMWAAELPYQSGMFPVPSTLKVRSTGVGVVAFSSMQIHVAHKTATGSLACTILKL